MIENNKANPKGQCPASGVTYFPAKKYDRQTGKYTHTDIQIIMLTAKQLEAEDNKTDRKGDSALCLSIFLSISLYTTYIYI